MAIMEYVFLKAEMGIITLKYSMQSFIAVVVKHYLC